MEEKWHRGRELRHNATDAERRLWQHLRGRQLEGFKFRRQYPIARYIADFACVEAGVVVELDGGQHGVQSAYDAQRSLALGAAGYRVLRFWNDEVFNNMHGIIDVIRATLLQPHPNPPLSGRGGSAA